MSAEEAQSTPNLTVAVPQDEEAMAPEQDVARNEDAPPQSDGPIPPAQIQAVPQPPLNTPQFHTIVRQDSFLQLHAAMQWMMENMVPKTEFENYKQQLSHEMDAKFKHLQDSVDTIKKREKERLKEGQGPWAQSIEDRLDMLESGESSAQTLKSPTPEAGRATPKMGGRDALLGEVRILKREVQEVKDKFDAGQKLVAEAHKVSLDVESRVGTIEPSVEEHHKALEALSKGEKPQLSAAPPAKKVDLGPLERKVDQKADAQALKDLEYKFTQLQNLYLMQMDNMKKKLSSRENQGQAADSAANAGADETQEYPMEGTIPEFGEMHMQILEHQKLLTKIEKLLNEKADRAEMDVFMKSKGKNGKPVGSDEASEKDTFLMSGRQVSPNATPIQIAEWIDELAHRMEAAEAMLSVVQERTGRKADTAILEKLRVEMEEHLSNMQGLLAKESQDK
ncbi:hypothetical protein CYMTET_25261, partial [Cymbomonas tetramitiformis]